MSATPPARILHGSNNPFEDPDEPTQAEYDAAAVLTVDRNATLTLGTDALIVLDEGLVHKREARNCCGLLPQLSKTTRAIPFYNVLWAELNDFDVTIHYAQPTGKKGCRVAYINYTVTDKGLHATAKRWVDGLMSRAYPHGVSRRKRIKVLVNPFGGQGYAQKLWSRDVEPIFAASHCEVEVEKTAYRGHAVEIAEKMDVDAYDVVACASGDGLPHEVFNGLAKQKNPRRALKQVAVVQIPCGSGNALSLNLNGTDSPSLAAVAIVKGIKTPMDLIAITQGDQKYYSFLSQAVGIIAETDLGTESLRWMGSFRFTWGVLVRLLGKTIWPAEVSVCVEEADKNNIRSEYRRYVEEHLAATAKKLPSGSDSDSEAESSQPVASSAGETSSLPPLRYGTINDPLPTTFETTDMPTLGNFYVGNMPYMSPDAPFFPAALPVDGRMDLVNIDGMTPRLTSLRMVTSIDSGGIMNFPEVNYRKVTGYRITPRYAPDGPGRLKAKFKRWLGGAGKEKEGFIAIDGERVPFAPFQAEVVEGLGTVLSKRGAVYEFSGPKSP